MLHPEALHLTPREDDVFRLIVSGKTHGEISAELFISKHTAREYIARIYRKFEAHSRSALIARAIAAGVLVLIFKGEIVPAPAPVHPSFRPVAAPQGANSQPVRGFRTMTADPQLHGNPPPAIHREDQGR